MTIIPGIQALGTSLIDVGKTADAATAASPAGGFAGMIQSQLTKLNEAQATSDSVAQDLAANRVDDVAQAMLSVEKANVQLQYATQLRNKAIEAYQEILRMQI